MRHTRHCGITALISGNNSIDVAYQFALQELHEADDIAELAGKYFQRFNVDPARFSPKG